LIPRVSPPSHPSPYAGEGACRRALGIPSYAETVDQPTPIPEAPRCRNPDDQVFVDLLVSTGADALVTGDGDLLAIAAQSILPILTPAQLRETLRGE
jgi:predicted nucleic acid-binding protein